jgi:hypothetical protein
MRYISVCLAFILAVSAGCSGSSAKLGNAIEPPSTQGVTGTVTMNGKPVTGLMIQFEMTNGMSSQGMSGFLSGDGKYKVDLPDGSYFVYFSDGGIVEGDLEKSLATFQSIPAKYRKAKDTPLRFEMKTGGPRTHDITLVP